MSRKDEKSKEKRFLKSDWESEWAMQNFWNEAKHLEKKKLLSKVRKSLGLPPKSEAH